jgi:hypothetical protein
MRFGTPDHELNALRGHHPTSFDRSARLVGKPF